MKAKPRSHLKPERYQEANTTTSYKQLFQTDVLGEAIYKHNLEEMNMKIYKH